MSTIRPFDERRLSGASGEAIAAAAWPGEGEPLVCVHGLTSSSRAFAGLANELPGRRVLAIDCRGRGRSTKRGPFGLARHVADLAGAMDSAGIGELALLQTWAQERKADLKCAGANPVVRTLLDLTNLDSVLEVHPTLDGALEAFREEHACADC